MPKSEPANPEISAGARAKKIVKSLAKTYPDAECALHHDGAFQLLVATILSAQCTDERVNSVTPALFAKYPEPVDLANSQQEDVEQIIHSLGFFRAKATNLRSMAKLLVEKFNGTLPLTVEEMTELPGVGRKTANVVLGTVHGLATGVVVDTHVRRISNLLGLTASDNPVQIEKDLMALLPETEWVNFSHRLIHHGRKVCIARRPKCSACDLLTLCPRVGLPPLETA